MNAKRQDLEYTKGNEETYTKDLAAKYITQKATIQSYEKIIEDLRIEVQELYDTVELNDKSAEKRFDEEEGYIRTLEEDIHEYKSQIAELREDLKQKDEFMGCRGAEIQMLIEQNEKRFRIIQELQGKEADLEETIRALEESSDAAHCREIELKDDIRGLIDGRTEELNRCQDNVAGLDTLIKDQNIQIKQCGEKVRQLRTEV